MWWIGLGGPRSGRIVSPASRLITTGEKRVRPRGATIGPGGRTAGDTGQKATAQAEAMAGRLGTSRPLGQEEQPLASAIAPARLAFACGIAMGIATAATTCPKSPMPKATSSVSARK